MKSTLLKIYYIFLKGIEYFTIINNHLINIVKQPLIVHSTDETLEFIINEGVSVSRFGDGEFGLINGQGLIFQSYVPELGVRLREIITSNQEKHIVCIPDVFKSVEWCTEKAKNY
jgi:hypothetical protein